MAKIEKPEQSVFTIALLLLDGFNAMAMQALVDPFRSANYLRGERRYEWHFLSMNRRNRAGKIGDPQAAACGHVFSVHA